MTYIFSVQTEPASFAESLYLLKEHLKSVGWTVPSSSDGFTYNSSGDQITHGSTGANGFHNPYAWFRVRMPGSTREFCFQHHSNPTPATFVRIKYCASGGFVSGIPSSYRVPSAASEAVLVGSGTDASPTFEYFGPGDGVAWSHFCADNAAPYGFYMVQQQKSNNDLKIMGSLCLDPLDQYASADTDPYVIHVGKLSPTFNYAAASATGLMVETKSNIAAKMGSSFTLQVSAFDVAVWSSNLVNFYGIGSSGVGLNSFNSYIDLKPLLYGRRNGLGAPVGYKGYSTMLKSLSFSGANENYTLTTLAARDHIVMANGTTALPWNGSVKGTNVNANYNTSTYAVQAMPPARRRSRQKFNALLQTY